MSSTPPHQEPLVLPAGQGGVRGSILLQLKRSQSLTTKELASRLGVSLNAVRHHLRDLEQHGLVEYQIERRGVGAPVFAYRLAEAGLALFPRRYETLLLGLLQQLVRTQGREQAVALLDAHFKSLAERVQPDLADSSPDQRLKKVASLLSIEGYMAEAAPETLTEHNCAIREVAEQFPEICDAEAKFLSSVLNADVQRKRHILNGCTACEYRVRPAGSEAAVEGNA
jgi:DeoR family transcriptional regulator, suf operon transcriptional repressor